jgi:predicted kinase
MTRGKLTFTIGLPRSGKSTFAQDWVRRPNLEMDQPSNFVVVRPRVIVSGDAFRLALHGQAYESLAESFVFAAMDTATRALLDSGHDVIVDETSTTENTILRYLRIDIDAEPIWIDTSLHVCLRRAIDTNRPYLIKPIHRMNDNLARLRSQWPANFERLKDQIRTRWDHDRKNTH